MQIVYTNKEEYEISLTYYDYYHDYVVAGVSKIDFLLLVSLELLGHSDTNWHSCSHIMQHVIQQVIGLINFLLYAVGGQLLHNKTKRLAERQPKVVIIRTTLDNNGRPIKTKKKSSNLLSKL